MKKLFLLFIVIAGAATACNNSNSEVPVTASSASSSVDSATKAAPDTIRPSMDTTAKKPVSQ